MSNYDILSDMQRKYYIKDIEKHLKVHRKTFYSWEKAGKIPKAKRESMSNYRYWTEDDIIKLKKLTGRG
jgi:DNA-binding transcriptional MerR regulator